MVHFKLGKWDEKDVISVCHERGRQALSLPAVFRNRLALDIYIFVASWLQEIANTDSAGVNVSSVIGCSIYCW